MRGLKDKAGGLVLLTATPMQVHPVEVWELLCLPPDWASRRFLYYSKTSNIRVVPRRLLKH